jgi:GH24 family phage-related lysozyme (muramidase)
MDYLKKSAELLAGTGFEGNIPFMYLDTEGWVTAGVGQMIPDVNAAKRYHFVKPLGEKATAEEIERDYRRVHAMPAGKPAQTYRVQESLELSQDYIESILLNKLKECDSVLRRHYQPKYDRFPEPVKLALLDMIYNLGASKLFGQFAAFEKAVNAEDWRTAALECHRKHRGSTDNRNAWTRHQFLVAETQKPIPALPVHPAHRDSQTILPGRP